MLELFKQNTGEIPDDKESMDVKQEEMEHTVFAEWLARQPADRKQMYLQLAMAYGFRMHGVSAEGKESENE